MANSPVGRFWLALPWLILTCGAPLIAWWMLEPVPLTINYVAPAFLTHEAKTREEAARYYVSEIEGGGTLFRFVSFCVSRPFNATSHRSWVGKALSWPAPDLPTGLSRTPGCYDASIAVDIPTSSPTRKFAFVQTLEIPMNPIRTATIEFQPLQLTILAPEECKK
jgi:hypothetical protein